VRTVYQRNAVIFQYNPLEADSQLNTQHTLPPSSPKGLLRCVYRRGRIHPLGRIGKAAENRCGQRRDVKYAKFNGLLQSSTSRSRSTSGKASTAASAIARGLEAEGVTFRVTDNPFTETSQGNTVGGRTALARQLLGLFYRCIRPLLTHGLQVHGKRA